MPKGIYDRTGLRFPNRKKGYRFKLRCGRPPFRKLLLDRLSELIRARHGKQPPTLKGDKKYLHYFGLTTDEMVTYWSRQAYKHGYKRTDFGLHWTLKQLYSPRIDQDCFIALSDIALTPLSESVKLTPQEQGTALYAIVRKWVERAMGNGGGQALLAFPPNCPRIRAVPLENSVLEALNIEISGKTRRIVAGLLCEMGARRLVDHGTRFYRGLEVRPSLELEFS